MERQDVKRKFVDLDDQEQVVGSSKKRRFDPSTSAKACALKFLFLCYIRILNEFVGKEHLPNIHIANIVASAIISGFNALKQEATGEGRLGQKLLNKKLECRIDNTVKALFFTRVKEIIKICLLEAGITLSKPLPDATLKMIGTMMPILTYSYLNKLRRDELRVGHSKFDVARGENEVSSVETSSLGIEGSMHILCEGITFPPERKSSMCQALGPLTIAVELLRRKPQPKYNRKWVEALSVVIGHIPRSQEIIYFLEKSTSKECAPLIKALGKLLLIVGERHTQRASVPMNFWVRIWFNAYIDAAIKSENGKYLPVNFADLNEEALCNQIDFSGDGLWRTYVNASTMGWTYSGTWDPQILSQIVFHTIFGTFKENLSMLSLITDVEDWKTRKEIGDSFKGTGSTGTSTSFKLPKVKYFSKMSSANPTAIFAGRSEQVCTASPFAGKHSAIFGDKFFEYIKDDSSGSDRTVGSINNVIAELNRLTRDQTTTLEANKGRQERGNVLWMPIDQLSVRREDRVGGLMLIPSTIKMFLQDS